MGFLGDSGSELKKTASKGVRLDLKRSVPEIVLVVMGPELLVPEISQA